MGMSWTIAVCPFEKSVKLFVLNYYQSFYFLAILLAGCKTIQVAKNQPFFFYLRSLGSSNHLLSLWHLSRSCKQNDFLEAFRALFLVWTLFVEWTAYSPTLKSVASLTKRTGDLRSFRTLRGVLLSPDPLEQKQPGSRVQSIGGFFSSVSSVVLKGSLLLQASFCELVLSRKATRTVFIPLAELMDSTHFAWFSFLSGQ